MPNTIDKKEYHFDLLNYRGENYQMRYNEDIFVERRYDDQPYVVPLFSFGFDFSYTSFAYRDPSSRADTLALSGSSPNHSAHYGTRAQFRRFEAVGLVAGLCYNHRR